MAEFVQKSIEEIVPELEQMERVGLFTKEESRAILKKRTAFEYKLRRKTKQKEDILQYIQYEINALHLVRKRRQKTGYTFKKMEIDVPIVQRIHKLFRLAIFRFQNDVGLWLSHIAFSKNRNEKAAVSRQYLRMLQVHSRKPELWIDAATWEFEKIMSTENARSLMQRGIRFNPKSQQLWLEYYRLELLCTDKTRKRLKILGTNIDEGTEVSDAVIEGQVAPLVFNQAMLAIPNKIEFCLSFLPVCRLFDFTQESESKIFELLSDTFPDDELMWDAVARRHIEDLSQHPKQIKIEVLDKCHSVFKDATNRLPTEKMWMLYVKFCLDMLSVTDQKYDKHQELRHICSILEEGQTAGKLSASIYFEWVQLLLKTSKIDQALEVSCLATKKYQQSVLLWKQHLQMVINGKNNNSNIQGSFQKALQLLKTEESLPIWHMAIEWSMLNLPDQTELFLQQGTQSCCRDVAVVMKECYLEWTALSAGSKKVKETYTRLSHSSPLSANFFRKFIEIENSKEKPKIKTQRDAYEAALRHFGTHDIDLWLEYITLELKHRKGKPEKVGQIHYRAVKSLDDHLVDKFVTRYTLLQTGHAQLK